MKIEPKQQERLFQMLDKHFPEGTKALSPQGLSVLDRIVSRIVIEAGGPDNVTPAQIEGGVEIYGEMWNEGFTVLRP